MTVADVYRAVAQDRVFYRKSRGGVTISGGEPFFQFDFLKSLLRVLHGRYIHTAVETCGHTEWSKIAELLPHIDLVLFDLKVNDSRRHVEYTGVDNGLIIENFKRLLASEVPLWIRLPIIPGYNDDSDNISFISELASAAGNVQRISLLPYHQYGINKYAGIGSTYSLHDVAPPSKERLSEIEAGFRRSLPAVEIEIGG
jgi:pyruvate formate lyase activating enzyme